MATDIFAKLGDIKGESADAKHKDEIEVLSFSWGVAASSASLSASHWSVRFQFHTLSQISIPLRSASGKRGIPMTQDIATILDRHAKDRTELMDILWDVQRSYGYIPAEAAQR